MNAIDTKSPAPTLEPTLPSSWYLDAAIFALEREHIFFREWICVGRVADLDAAGHLVVDMLGQSVVVVRNAAGALKAFYNVCRHRGAELCTARELEEREGRAPIRGGVVGRNLIRCAYHSWAYDFDGNLVAAPYLADADFPKRDFALHPVGADEWGGFLFLHMTPGEARPLSEQLGEMPGRVARYPLAELRGGATIRYEVDANWKVICENYNECYHCGPVHPELCAVVPAFRESGGANLEWDRGIPHRDGAYTFTATGTTTRRPFPGLNEDERTRHKGELVYPNLFLSLACDHATCFVLKPRAVGRTTIDCLFLFEPHEMEKPGFDPSDAVDFWDLVNRQDWSVCDRVQRGMGARVHNSGFYAPMEDWNLDIRRYVTSRIGPHVGPDSGEPASAG